MEGVQNILNKSLRKEWLKLDSASCISVILLVLLVFLCIAISILCFTPPVSKDALTHHLAVPKLYLKHGGIYQIPFMPYSYYPMNLDLLYLLPLHFGNDIVPKFIHFGFALLTAWLIFGYLKRRINITYALFGVIFFLSVPIIVKLSITVYVDLGLIFFSTASLLSLLKWFESGFRGRFLILSAISCGLGMGTKYNGLVALFLLTLFVPFILSRYTQGTRARFFRVAGYSMIFAGIALLVFSPWMIRNFVWTGNPIYPLYDHWFNSQSAMLQSAPSIFEIRSRIYHESWWQMALMPLRVFFQGQDGNPQYFDGKLNPFLFLFPFLAFYKVKNDSNTIRAEKKILLAFAILYFAFSFFSAAVRIRYISPIISPLVLLSVYGIKNMLDLGKDRNSPRLRHTGIILTLGIISFSLFLNVVYIFKQYNEVDPFSFLTGKVSRDEYIDRYRFEYPVVRYINKNVPENAKILFIYIGNRGYYCDREYIFDMIHNTSFLSNLVKQANDPEEVLAGLRRMGITHLFIRYDLFEPWIRNQFNLKDTQVWNAFLRKSVKLLYFKWGYGVSVLEGSN